MGRFLKAIVMILFACNFEPGPMVLEENPCMPLYNLPQPFPPFERQANGGNEKPLSEWGMLARGKTLGKSIVVPTQVPAANFDLSQGQRTDILTVQGDDEYALNLNICLAPPKFIASIPADIPLQNISSAQSNSEFPASATTFPITFAVIEWGIGGVNNKAEIDFVNGANINVNASYVRVTAKSFSPIGTLVGVIPAVQVSCFVGPGVARNEVAQKTIPFSIVLSGRSVIFPIPAFAKRVRGMGVDRASGAAVPFEIEFWADAATSLLIGRETVTSTDEIAIPNGAYYFNGRATASVTGQMIFELAL